MIDSLLKAGALLAVGFLALIPVRTGAEPATRQYHFVLIAPNDTTPFWRSVHSGALKARDEFASKGIDIHLEWVAPATPDNLAQQIDLAGNAVGASPDGIAIGPLDAHKLVPPMELATRQKIPVVTMEMYLDYALVACSVATNNYQCGAEGSVIMGKLLNDRGRVLMIRHDFSDPITVKREDGFLDGVRKYSDSLEVIAPDQYAGKTEEEAYQLTKKLLKQYDHQISGIYTACPQTTLGAHRALKELGLDGRIKQVGYLVGEDGLKAVKAGDLQGLIAPDPSHLGFLTVKMLYESVRGMPVSPRVDVGHATVTADNLQDPSVLEILAPDSALTPSH